MIFTDRQQILHVLENLSNLEISFMEYSSKVINYEAYRTYVNYMGSYAIRKNNLSRFYFTSVPDQTALTMKITDLPYVSDVSAIDPGFRFSIGKILNFPDATLHKCDYFSMFYLMEGRARIHCGESDLTLSVGDFCLIPPMCDYSITSEPESIMIFFNLRTFYISANFRHLFQEDPAIMKFIDSCFESEHAERYLTIHTSNSLPIRNKVLDILLEYINQNKFCDSAMNHLLSLLFMNILREDTTVIDSPSAVSHSELAYHDICNYLNQNYQTASLTDLADTLHFSKQYVCKIVKANSGKTFNTLLMDTRLGIVSDFLVHSSLPLEVIAELSGFSNSAHLSRSFKAYFGATPSEYRRQNRQA